jgi:phosphoesterase RecJ-like protein
MALTEKQQILELIKKHKSILIIFKKDWTGDSLASSLAIYKTLKKIDKRVDIVCHDFASAKNLSFLGLPEIKSSIKNIQKFVVSIDTSKTEIGEFYYDQKNNKLNFYISPKNGQFTESDVSANIAHYEYDLILIIDSPDLDSLGSSYSEHSDFFYSTPKINIDHSNKNEYFGDINITDLTSASTAEIVYDLIKNLDPNLIDDDIATCLLAGVISSTKNFKTLNISPQTLSIASELITQGARREEIISNLYQSRFLSTLKLWGRVLTRLNNNLDDKLVWSTIGSQDFLETATTHEELVDVIDELIVSMPKTEIIVLIYEKPDNQGLEVIVYSVKNLNSLFIVKKYNPQGNTDMAKFQLSNISLAEAEREIIGEIKHKIG